MRRWGLPKPDHKLFESHPLLNTQLLHYLQHGDITAKPGIERFDGPDVVFTDGSRAQIDLVVFATGYDMSIPYVPDDYVDWKSHRPDLYLNVFSRRKDNLFGVSYIEVNSSAYTLFDHIAALHRAVPRRRTRPTAGGGTVQEAGAARPARPERRHPLRRHRPARHVCRGARIPQAAAAHRPPAQAGARSRPACSTAYADRREQHVTQPRLALVTGAGGGIGLGVARMLRERGYCIVAVDISDAAAASAAERIGGSAIPVACDASDRTQVAALADRIRGEWSAELDVLVCNAGIIVPGTVAESAPDALTLQLDVMLGFPVQLINAAVPAFVARGNGHVLATVSMGGILSLPGSAVYSAAKSGLRAFLTALSAELAGSGVAVSGIYPSAVDTAMLRREARHGGSMLNFLGTVFTVDDVVKGYERALRTRRLEVYLPYIDRRHLAPRPLLAGSIQPTTSRARPARQARPREVPRAHRRGRLAHRPRTAAVSGR